jgi:hypothetical protein
LLQKWWNDIETDDRCQFYKIIKTEFGNEVFLKKLVNVDALCKLRSGCEKEIIFTGAKERHSHVDSVIR